MDSLSLRSTWYSFWGAVLLAATVLGGMWFYIHRNDADIRTVTIHVLSDLVPFLAALAIALWAERVTKFSHTTRVVIFLGGLAWSGVWGWRDLVDIRASKADISGAISTAVSTASTETKTQISGVRQDMDDRFSALNRDLDSGFTELKPPSPKIAKLTFGFFDNWPAKSEHLRADADGIFTVGLTVRNTVSDATAEGGDIWIDICAECLWVKTPDGFDQPTGTAEFERHEAFSSLNGDVGLPKITLKIKLTRSLASFPLAAKYTCKTCGAMNSPQQLVVNVLPEPKFNFPLKLN